jgi:hypothetical protein
VTAASALPPALRRWGPLVAAFPPELRLALGPWLARLEQALGSVHGPTRAPSGELDGVSGVGRRGHYERLLLGEWLLADAAPDEFLRRAAAREHLFLELARRAPSATARQVALFDAGPDQLGAPRLVHVAALVVLAGRAARAGARFAWGVLQDDPDALVEAVDPAGVERLLAARSARPVEDDDLERWRAALPAGAGAGAGETLWLVGGPALAARRVPGAARVVVSDPLEPALARLDVRVVRPGGGAQALALDMPDERTAARLVRHPFSMPAPARPVSVRGVDADTPLVFTADGRHLLLRDRLGGLRALAVPDPGAPPPARQRQLELPPGHALVAAGWHRRRPAAITLFDERLWLCGALAKGAPGLHAIDAHELLDALVAPGAHAAPSPIVTRATAASPCLVFHDYRGMLYELRLASLALKALPYRAAALASLGGKLLAVAEDVLGRARVRQAGVLGPAGLAPFDLDVRGSAAPGAFFAGLGDLDMPGRGVVAARRDEGTWWVHWGGPTTHTVLLAAPTGTTVAGVGRLALGGRAPEPALLVVDEDPPGLSLLGRFGARRVASAPARITRTAFASPRAVCAAACADGTLIMVRGADGVVVARHTLEAVGP